MLMLNDYQHLDQVKAQKWAAHVAQQGYSYVFLCYDDRNVRRPWVVFYG